MRWGNPDKARYYQVELLQDLLGDWTLVQCWGGIGSHLGGQRIVWVESPEAGLTRIRQIRAKRRQHGYHEQALGEHP